MNIFPLRLILTACLVYLSFVATPVLAAGLFVTNDQSQVVPTESRGALIFDDKKETLYLSTTFAFNHLTMWNFAWIVVVPTKPQVTLLQDDLFLRLDEFMDKKNPKKKAPFLKSSINNRPAYFILHEIFDLKTQQGNFQKWLDNKGYLLPKTALPQLKEYAKNNWYAVVAEIDGVHLQNTAKDSLLVSSAHTMPLKISFKTDQIILPLGLTAIQPDIDSQPIPLSFAYGQKSEKVLGESDAMIDSLLSKQSRRRYPALPLETMYLKTDLFVFAPHEVSAGQFFTDFTVKAHSRDFQFINRKKKPYFSLPKQRMSLTHLTAFTPMVQLTDVWVRQAKKSPLFQIGQ